MKKKVDFDELVKMVVNSVERDKSQEHVELFSLMWMVVESLGVIHVKDNDEFFMKGTNPSILTIQVPSSSDLYCIASNGEEVELSGRNCATFIKDFVCLAISRYSCTNPVSCMQSCQQLKNTMRVKYKEYDHHHTYEQYILDLIGIVDLVDSDDIENIIKNKPSFPLEMIQHLTQIEAYGISFRTRIAVSSGDNVPDIEHMTSKLFLFVPQSSKFVYKGKQIAGEDAMSFFRESMLLKISPEFFDEVDLKTVVVPGLHWDNHMMNCAVDRLRLVVDTYKSAYNN